MYHFEISPGTASMYTEKGAPLNDPSKDYSMPFSYHTLGISGTVTDQLPNHYLVFS